MLANQSVIAIFLRSSCPIFLAIKSYLSSLVISITRAIEPVRQRPKIFKFEAAWQLREDCPLVITDDWALGPNNAQNQLMNYKKSLLTWQGALKR